MGIASAEIDVGIWLRIDLVYVPSHPKTLHVHEHECPIREDFVPFANWVQLPNLRTNMKIRDATYKLKAWGSYTITISSLDT